MNKSMQDVIIERERQSKEEGFNHLHDLNHDPGALAGAGASYAINAASQLHPEVQAPVDYIPEYWPFHESWWKPKDARRDLVRAAALIIAEIDRIDLSASLENVMPFER